MKNDKENEIKNEDEEIKSENEQEVKSENENSQIIVKDEDDNSSDTLSSIKKEQLKKKARERQKRYRERLTNEKKEHIKTLAKERMKKNRNKIVSESDEELKKIAKKAHSKKYWNSTRDEKKQLVKEKVKKHQKKYCENFTEDRKEVKKLSREKMKKAREKVKYENDEERKKVIREQIKKYRQNLSPEEKEKLKKKAREQQKRYRERLSLEKKEELKRIAREQKKKYRERMSQEKKELLNRLAREQKILYREKINNQKQELFKRFAKEQQNSYQRSSINKNDYLIRLAKAQQKIYSEKLEEQLDNINETQTDDIGKITEVLKLFENQPEDALVGIDESFIDGQFKGFKSDGQLSESEMEDEALCGDIFEREKRQCCGCGLILSKEEFLIEHIKNSHSKSFEFIEKLWNNVTIVQNLMALKEETSPNEANNVLPQTSFIPRAGFIEPEKLICKSLEGGKTTCGTCGLILSSNELLDCHVKVKHIGKPVENIQKLEDEIVQCPICHENCNMFGLHTHINNVHFVKRTASHGCDDCGLFFKSDVCLAYHYVNLKSKMNSINFKDFDMTDFSHMDKEKDSSGNESAEMDKSNKSSKGVKIYKCKLCKYAHKYSFGLLKHVLKIHLFECPLECPFCDIKTKRRDYFKSHLESMHPDTNTSYQLICEVCGYASLNKTTFKNHVRNHSKLYECEYCDYTTSLITSINVHRRKHTKQKPYKCDFPGCLYECNHKSSLTQHNFTHYPEKYLQFCDICGFRTVNKYLMKSHLKDHSSGHDMFTCVQCPYTTNIKANLVNHSIVHKEVTQCTMCEFTTKYNLTMRKHMGTKHGIIIKNRWRKQNTLHI